MKRIISLLIVLSALFSSVPVFADLQSAQLEYFDMICTYTVENGEITVTDCLETVSGSLVIPADVRGNKVTRISTHAFKDCYYLTDITLPDTLTTIGDYAFENCIFLDRIYIPSSVNSIGYYAFYMTHTNLKILGDSNNSYAKAYAKVYELDYVHKMPGTTMVVNGTTHDKDPQPYKEYNKTNLPLRPVAQMLGYTVEWNSDNSIRISGEDYSALLTVGNTEASVMREKVMFDDGAFYKDGTTYISLEDITKMFNCKIVYDKAFDIIYIDSIS